MIYKISLQIILWTAFFFASFWTFNHINAWLGIALFIGGLISLINYFFKHSKKEKK